MSFTYDPTAYANATRLAGNAFRNADKNSNAWAQMSLAAILLGKLEMVDVASRLYAEMKPLTARGKPAEHKENDNGTISVSSIRGGTGHPCNGGEGALKAFNALQFIVQNKAVLPDEVEQFAIKGGKLFGLANAIKAEKAKQAKAKREADAANDDSNGEPMPEREGDDAPATDTDGPSNVERIAAFNEFLATLDPATLSDAEQLALVGTMRAIAALESANAEGEREAA